MAISNNSTGLRPGVCTSTTRPSAPYEGQMIYETDTNRVLVWDNAAWVMIADTDTPPGLQLIKTQTIGSGVTSVTMTDVFSSEFSSYKIVFSNLTFSSVDFMTMRLVVGSTSNTTSNYYSSNLQVTTGGSVSGFGVSAGSYWNAGVVGFTAASGGVIDIYNPQAAVATSFTSQGVDTRTDGAPHRTGSGFFNASTQFDGFWVSTVNGGYTMGGTIRVYGYRN